MGVEDLPWRKFPRDAISNVKIRFIQKQLEPHLRHGALLFFTTAYCLADDNGVIDIEDGLVFADAMDIDNPDDVFVIANLFASRGIMDKITERIFMFIEWDVPNRERTARAPLTAAQRRAAVQAQLQQKATQANDKPPDVVPKVAKTVATKNEKMSLHAPCSDKKCESVATHREKREKEKKETHTQETAHLAHDALCAHSAPCGTAQECEKQEQDRKTEKTTETQRKTQEKTAIRHTQGEECTDGSNTPEKDISDTKTITVGERIDKAPDPEKGDRPCAYLETLEVLQAFFEKHNPSGYPEQQKEQKAIISLIHRINLLQDTTNSAEIIAVNFCRCFKKLTEQHPYYKGMPLLPSNLVKPGAFSVVFDETAKILRPKNREWQKKYEKMVAESTQDEAVYGNDDYLGAQCKAYGINPDSPDRVRQLLVAQNVHKRQVGLDDTG